MPEVEDGMGFAGLCATDASEERCWKELGERNAQLQEALALLEPYRWRPIETAPKMKNILLFAVSDLADDGRVRNWKMDTGYWHTNAECWNWAGSQVRKYDVQPTHWMPLPAPPERVALAEGRGE